jgi:hypothetical protein
MTARPSPNTASSRSQRSAVGASRPSSSPASRSPTRQAAKNTPVFTSERRQARSGLKIIAAAASISRIAKGASGLR